MIVELCWKTKDTPANKIHVSKRMSVKEAKEYFEKNLKEEATFAYLRKFDGWHYTVHSYLKK